MAEVMHPTKLQLMDTMEQLIDSKNDAEVVVDEVLSESGISRGSLYHHFHDFPDLVEQTLMRRFSRGVDENINMLRDIFEKSHTREEYVRGLRNLTAYSQSPLLARRRVERARIIGMTMSSKRLADALAAEQERVTNEITEQFERLMQRGWTRTDVSARTLAVFVQAYTLGRVVDDISQQHMDSADWENLIGLLLSVLMETSDTNAN